jgi:hypothetical protein
LGCVIDSNQANDLGYSGGAAVSAKRRTDRRF